MSATFPIRFQKELSDLLAEGHRRFGKVAPRRPYQEDEGGDTGASRLLFEEHPFLAEQPLGASSDLTFITTNNKYSEEEAENRAGQASPELTKQLDLALGAKAEAQKTHPATLNPYGG